MKSVKMFETSWCPHCKSARRFMEELVVENPKYKEIQLEIIDEERFPDIANQYNYYYVPTYYVNQDKVHEGIPNKTLIKQIFDNALL